MPRSRARAISFWPEYLLIAAVCAGLAALVWYATFERVAHERAEAIGAAVRSNDNLALALEEQTVRAIKAAEQILVFMKHELEVNQRPITLERLVETGLAEGNIFAAAFIVDADGRVLLPNGRPGPTSLADRDFLAFHRQSPAGVVRVNPPLVGRLTGRAVIPVTMRRTLGDGSFGGVFVVGIEAAYFISSYQRFDIGRDGLIALVGRDGVSRARSASGVSSYGVDMRESSLLREAQRLPVGSFVTAGRVEGAARYASYRTLADYDLIVAVGTSIKETLAQFNERQRSYYIAAIAATAVLAAFAAALIFATWRRIRAMRDLRASEQALRATFDQGAVGIAHHDPAGRFIAANARYCEMVGYTREELAQRTFLDILVPEERSRAREGHRQLLDAAQARMLSNAAAAPLQVETRHVRKDGSILWCSVSLAVVRKADGTPDYSIAMIQDIGERKAAEARLLEQLDELRRFQAVTVDRELRMMELEAELRELRAKRAA